MTAVHAIDYGRIPGEVVELCRRLRGAGHEAYLVGGGVRDLLLARPVHDWDVATAARPEQVQQLFRKTIPTGIKHGTVTVVLPSGRGVEVTTFRGEAGYSDGRHPDAVAFVDAVELDLGRRDLTVNAMALDPVARLLVDPHGGAEDLQRQLIRAVGDPLARFGEDGLRPLRAVRFAATLEFALDEPTLAAIPQVIPRFLLVSAERVRDELLKLLEARRPSVGVALMRRAGLLPHVLPELDAAVGVTQNRFHADDVYQHSLATCDLAPRGDVILRLAALLHDVGKPLTARPHPERQGEQSFHHHEQVGATLCAALAERLRLSAAQRERLCHLVRHHLFELEGWTAPGLRRFLQRVGPEHVDDLFALRAADLGSRPDGPTRLALLAALRERLAELQRQPVALRVTGLVVDGAAVMARLGIAPGPRVGQILRALLERVTEDPALNEREALLCLVDELGPRS